MQRKGKRKISFVFLLNVVIPLINENGLRLKERKIILFDGNDFVVKFVMFI